MINYLSRTLILKLFFTLLSIGAFSQDVDSITMPAASQDAAIEVDCKTATIKNLTGKTISEVYKSTLIGEIIDMHFPNKLLNCYVFIFRKDNITYGIAANTEYTIDSKMILEKIDMNHFIAIGYYAISYPNGKLKKMFKSPSNTPFDHLDHIKPEEYISVAEIEKMENLGAKMSGLDKGGFYSPFFSYYYNLGDAVLMLRGSPSDEKSKSYFMGAWSFWKK